MGYSFSYSLDEDSLFTLIVPSSCQFGFPFHLSEEQVSRPGHLDLPHLFLVNEFDGGVMELLTE